MFEQMQRGQAGLMLVHRVVESLYQSPHRRLATNTFEG
jgi:hypothetical protein